MPLHNTRVRAARGCIRSSRTRVYGRHQCRARTTSPASGACPAGTPDSPLNSTNGRPVCSGRSGGVASPRLRSMRAGMSRRGSTAQSRANLTARHVLPCRAHRASGVSRRPAIGDRVPVVGRLTSSGAAPPMQRKDSPHAKRAGSNGAGATRRPRPSGREHRRCRRSCPRHHAVAVADTGSYARARGDQGMSSRLIGSHRTASPVRTTDGAVMPPPPPARRAVCSWGGVVRETPSVQHETRPSVKNTGPRAASVAAGGHRRRA